MPLPPLLPEQLVKPRHFEFRIALIFAALFIPLGAHLPYFPLWLEAKGFDAEQIGIILAAPMFLRVVTTPVITALADRAKDRANVLIALAVAALVMSLGYFLQPDLRDRPSGVARASDRLDHAFAACRFAGAVRRQAVRLQLSRHAHLGVDGLPVRQFHRRRHPRRHQRRRCALDDHGRARPHARCRAVCAAPRQARRASPLSATELQDAAPKLMNRYFLLIVAGVGIINASHGFLFGFVSIYWKSIGISDTVLGLLWAFAVVSEVGIFLVFTRIFGSISATAVLGIAGVRRSRALGSLSADRSVGARRSGLLRGAEPACVFDWAFPYRAAKADCRNGAGRAHRRRARHRFFRERLRHGDRHAAVRSALRRLGVDGFYVMAAVAAIGLGLIVLAARSAPERRIGR